MIAHLERRWHFRWDDVDTVALAAQAAAGGGAPLLVIHAADDEQVLLIESEGLANDWPGAERFLAPEGCGHVRILRDAVVMEKIVSFITAAELSDGR